MSWLADDTSLLVRGDTVMDADTGQIKGHLGAKGTVSQFVSGNTCLLEYRAETGDMRLARVKLQGIGAPAQAQPAPTPPRPAPPPPPPRPAPPPRRRAGPPRHTWSPPPARRRGRIQFRQSVYACRGLTPSPGPTGAGGCEGHLLAD